MNILRSFKLKIALGAVMFTGLILLGFSAFFLSTARRIGLERMDGELAAMGHPQVNRFHPREHWPQLDESLRAIHEEGNRKVYEFLVVSRDGSRIYASRRWPAGVSERDLGISDPDGFPSELPLDDVRPDLQRPPLERLPPPDPFLDPRGNPEGRFLARPPPQPRFMTFAAEHRSWRVIIMKNPSLVLVLAVDLADFQSEVRSMRALLAMAIPVALLLLAAGGWLLAGQALRPVRTLTQVARQITAKDLHQRVPESGAVPEFEELIRILNGMLDRLEKSFQQATRFSADAAHELNTPLTILQGQIEQAIQSAASEPDQQLHAGLLEEVQRLKNIVRKLLLLAKADSGQLKLHPERIDLSAELDDLLDDADVLAQGLKVERDFSPGVSVMADPDLLRQVFQNLLSNAVKYNRPGGVIRMALRMEGAQALFTIGNTAQPSSSLDEKLLFTRFYRGDSSRSRQVEGVGLGLSLSREIVQAHRGTLVLRECRDGWVSFALTLPGESR